MAVTDDMPTGGDSGGGGSTGEGSTSGDQTPDAVYVDSLQRRVEELEQLVAQHESSLEQLFEQIEFFQILIDSIPTPLFYQNLKGEIRLCNMAFETVAQAIREQIIGKTIPEVIDDEELCLLLRAPEIDPSSMMDPTGREAEVCYADGSIRHVEVRHVLYFNLNGEPSGTVGLMIDMTDRKRAESAEIEAERLRTAREMAISIAHEFNNPLMIINGVHQLMMQKMGLDADDPFMEHCDRLPRAVMRMHGLVQKLQNLKRLKEAEYAAGQTFIDINASSSEEDADDDSGQE